MLRKLFVVVLVLAAVAIWLVPVESDYIARLAKDYGSIHSTVPIDPDQMQEMISYRFDHHLFYSEFICTYGNVSIKYKGFFTMIFYVESTERETRFDVVV